MSENQLITNLLNQLCEKDETIKQHAKEEIIAMGSDAIQPLSMIIYQQKGECYTEVYRIISAIGDAIIAKEGIEGLDKFIIKTFNFGAKKLRQHASEEVYEISVNALTRWGLEIPPILKQKVHNCHVCGKNSTELRVDRCALHSCDTQVCSNHAKVISTRFGQFDGSGGAWFCTDNHYTIANMNHLEWN